MSSETFWRRWFLSERTNILTKFFCTWRREGFDFWWNFPSRFSKLHSKCPEEFVEGKYFHRRKTVFLIFFRSLGGSFSAESSKLHSSSSEKQIEENYFYWEKLYFFLLIFGLRAKSFLQSFKTASYISRAKFGRKKYFLEKF